MKENKKDAYIKLLREAREELNGDGISITEFEKKLEILSIKQSKHDLYSQIYGAHEHQQRPQSKFHMSLEAYMKLLEYEELQHSLKESLEARKEAKVATRIAIATIILQILIEIF